MSAPQPTPPARTTNRRRLLVRVALVLCPLLALAILALVWALGENFHTVIPGQVFRSGQLSPKSLEGHIDRYHLRAIINLRGSNPQSSWYQDECQMTAHEGIRHYDLPVDSAYPPSADELHELIHLLETCPKPVLIHCQSGIDRTGLVAAICVLLLDDTGSPAAARDQLGLRYGHLFWRANTSRQRAFVEAYRGWLLKNGCVHSRDRFREWAFTVYDAPPPPDTPPAEDRAPAAAGHTMTESAH